VKVTDRHAAVDYAHPLRDISDTHFPAAEARRLAERFEWHYTPKHGSWLDMAESELGVLAAQCLDRRMPDKPSLIDEVTA
jgi:DDE superfamily endonuclease